jgi:hypothetical protein
MYRLWRNETLNFITCNQQKKRHPVFRDAHLLSCLIINGRVHLVRVHDRALILP